MNIRFYLSLIFPLTLTATGLVESDPIVQWMKQARLDNPAIRQAHSEWSAARARVLQARALPDPTVTVEIMGSDISEADRNIRIAQAFPWPGTIRSRSDVASFQAQSYWHEVQTIELETISRLQILAFRIAYLIKTRELTEANLEIFRKQEDFLTQQSRGGGDVVDLVRVGMESALLADELAQIDELILQEKFLIDALLGSEVSLDQIKGLQVPVGPHPPADTYGLREKLLRSNPTLQGLATRVDAARVGLRLARLENYPEFMFGVSYLRMNESSGHGVGGWSDDAGLMVSLSIPLWGDKKRGRSLEASALLDSAEQVYEGSLNELNARLGALLSRERDAQRRVALFRDQLLPRAQQAHESVESSYRAGKAGLLDLFDARRKLLEVEIRYWKALVDTHIVNAELQALFGTEISDSHL